MRRSWLQFVNKNYFSRSYSKKNVLTSRLQFETLDFPETDVEPLEEHMRSEHRPNLDSYENLCEGNCR